MRQLELSPLAQRFAGDLEQLTGDSYFNDYQEHEEFEHEQYEQYEQYEYEHGQIPPQTPEVGELLHADRMQNRSLVSSKKAPVSTTSSNKPSKKNKPLKKPLKKKPRARPKEQHSSEDEPDENESDDLYDEDDDEDSKFKHVDIARLPTTAQRLTAIDLILHHIRHRTPNKTVFDKFHELNDTHLTDILDLNMVNNHYIYRIQDLKLDKQDTRAEILKVRKEIATKNAQLERTRRQYHVIRQLITSRWKIKAQLQQQTLTNNKTPDVIPKLNRLSNVLDPNYSVLDKLKLINTKLHRLEQQLHATR